MSHRTYAFVPVRARWRWLTTWPRQAPDSWRPRRTGLSIDLWPYEVLAPRVWELRENMSAYDGSYVALAEMTGTTLATLDTRIARAPGVRCKVVTPRVN